METVPTINYKNDANEIRRTVLRMIYEAQTSHIGSNFGCIDILTVLYEKADFKKDKLIVSKGWVAASVYALGVKYGLMPQKAIDTFCKEGSKFIGLIEPLGYWGAEFAGGSMGMGFPAAVGFALAKKMKGEEGKVYVLMSDGELQCGTTWEGALIAAQHELDNLVVIVEVNGLQAMGKTKDILRTPDNFDIWYGLGWQVEDEDGHDHKRILEALNNANYNNPTIIFMRTVKGKGVSFMSNNNLWHYAQIKDDDYQKALQELNA